MPRTQQGYMGRQGINNLKKHVDASATSSPCPRGLPVTEGNYLSTKWPRKKVTSAWLWPSASALQLRPSSPLHVNMFVFSLSYSSHRTWRPRAHLQIDPYFHPSVAAGAKAQKPSSHPHLLPDQMGYVILPPCSGSALMFPFSRTCPEYLHRDCVLLAFQ